MDDIQPPIISPPNMPQTVPPPPGPSATPIPPGLLLALIGAVILILGGIIGLVAIRPSRIVAVPTPTPSIPTATPTPVRTFSPVASQSAFMNLETATASLSAQINAYNIQDQSLTPPVLVLPLGFTQ